MELRPLGPSVGVPAARLGGIPLAQVLLVLAWRLMARRLMVVWRLEEVVVRWRRLVVEGLVVWRWMRLRQVEVLR